MKRVYLIFDYFKEAFHINKDNKRLYYPQLGLICAKLLMIIIIGIRVYSWFDGSIFAIAMDGRRILQFFLSYGLKLLFMFLIYAIISVIIESGLYNMYKSCTVTGSVNEGDFSEGVRKYFFKFLLGNIMVSLAWVILSPVYIILGLITLTLGFAIIPIIISVFLTMWKVSLVMNDCGIFQAFEDSFRFARYNFLPLTVLQMIHWAFVKGVSTGGSAGNASSFRNSIDHGMPYAPGTPFLNRQYFYDTVLRIARIVVGIMIPVVTIATLVSSLVKMVFEVFFSLVLFTAYSRRFNEIPSVPCEEVAS